MFTRTATVGSQSGLHSRPAAIVAKAAAATGHPIRIGRDDDGLVNAASLLALISLGVGRGDRVVVAVESAEGEAALDEIVALLERDLDRT